MPLWRRGLLYFVPLFCLVAFLFLAKYTQRVRDSDFPWNPVNIRKLSEVAGEGPLSLAIIGDNLGSSLVFSEILKRIQADPDIKFVIHLGDSVYSGRRTSYLHFLERVKKHLHKPLILAVGNHELRGEGLELYGELFGPPYFSFRVRGACFVVLNNARKRRIDPVQKSWLARQLTNRDCAAKLVFMHMPIIDPRWGPDLYQQGALDLLDLLKRYGVSYVFFGHVHGFFSGRWGNVPYAVTGGAGAKLYGGDPEHFFFHYLKVTLGPDGKVAVQVERVEPVFSGFWNRFHYLCGEMLAFVRSHFFLFASLLLGAFLLLFFRLRG